MKKIKIQFVVVAVLSIAAGFFLVPSLTQAKPKGGSEQGLDDQRDGYSRNFMIDANSVELFEVPVGKDYVLLRVYSREMDGPPIWVWGESFWTLTVDGEMFLDQYTLSDPSRGAGTGVYIGEYVKEDFPDKCVVVHGGQTLAIKKHKDVEIINIALIGYFCDAQ